MPDSTYPLFEDGQTLTAPDLNQLRAFLHGRDRLLGRLTGFGVNCGLDGTVTGSALTIGAGLAIDQVGEPLLLPAPVTIQLPPTNDTGSVPFAFINSGAGNLSVVLESVDHVEAAPDCGDEDCGGHAEQHTRTVALRVVPGRIAGPRFDFAGEPLLGVEPMRLSLTSTPQGSYTTLRNAIVTRLTNAGSPLIDPALITVLQGTSIASSDLPGVRGYKAGFINQVLFATLDLLRCRALMATSCDRSTPRPGVVLGHLVQAGGTWAWDCTYRHAWEPPRGLSQALIGGGCDGPCGLYADALEALIAGYAPPDPPPPDDDDDDGPVIVFPWCPHGMVLVGGQCVNIYYPPPQIPPYWIEEWLIDPRDPLVNPPFLHDHIDRIVEDVYDHHRWDYLGAGTITTLPALGRNAEAMAAQLSDQIRDHAGTPNVKVVTAAQAAATSGYEPGGTMNLADTVLLTADAQGHVVATGRVPAAHTARQVGVELPAAAEAATRALGVAEAQQAGIAEVTERVGAVSQQMGGLVEEVAGLAQFSQETGQWRGQVDGVLAGMDAVIAGTVDKALGGNLQDIQVRLATAEGAIGVLSKGGGGPGGAAGGFGQRLDQDFAHGMTEFAETVIDGLSGLVDEKNEKTLGRYVGEMSRASAKLEVVAAGGDPIDIGDAAVALLGTMRTAVKSAGVDDAIRKQLDAQFNVVKGMLG